MLYGAEILRYFLKKRIKPRIATHIMIVTDSFRLQRTQDEDNCCLKGNTASAQTEVSERLRTMRKAVKQKLSEYIADSGLQCRLTKLCRRTAFLSV